MIVQTENGKIQMIQFLKMTDRLCPNKDFWLFEQLGVSKINSNHFVDGVRIT